MRANWDRLSAGATNGPIEYALGRNFRMQLIRCTAKLLKAVGLKPSALETDVPKFSFLGQWHANLIYIDRRKCLLFVNDRTLFNFIVPDVNQHHIRDIPNLFLAWFSCVISAEGFPDEVKTRILSEYEDLRIAQSSSRSVLGSANDLTFHYKYSILESGGVHSWRIPDIIIRMNRMPMQNLRFTYPIEELRRLFGLAV